MTGNKVVCIGGIEINSDCQIFFIITKLTPLFYMKKALLIFALLNISFAVLAQSPQKEKVYEVDMGARNAAIDNLTKAQQLIAAKQPDKSLHYITSAIKADSTLFESYGALYKACVTQKNYSDSIFSYFYIGQRIFTDSDDLCYFVGELFRFRKDYKKAIDQYTNAINLNTNKEEKSFYLPNFFSQRAFCYVKENRYKEAAEDYTTALKIDPEDELVLINRGVCYQKMKDDKKAVADWEKAVSLGSKLGQEYLDKLRKK